MMRNCHYKINSISYSNVLIEHMDLIIYKTSIPPLVLIGVSAEISLLRVASEIWSLIVRKMCIS